MANAENLGKIHNIFCIDKTHTIELLELEKDANNEKIIDAITEWSKDFEEENFNLNAAIKDDCYLTHKCIPDNIEFADLIQIKVDECRIYHVKDKFNCTMRELERQVELSMIKLDDLIKNNKNEYFLKLYDSSKNIIYRQNESELAKKFNDGREFIDKLKSIKNFIYVIVLHTNKESLLNSNSNIAKHCLNDLLLTSYNKGYKLKIQLV